jgi:hypothetical protein
VKLDLLNYIRPVKLRRRIRWFTERILDLRPVKLRQRIRWLTERILDAAFYINIKSPVNLSKGVVILHGSSCVGKSYVLRWLERRYKGCVFIEMDQFLYKNVLPDPGILKTALDLLTDAGVPVNQAKAFVQKIENVELVGGNPRHRSMVELLKACLVHDTVIATCGDLPAPGYDNGYWEMLCRYTSKTALHVLVAPESKVLAERIRIRNREAEMDRWLVGYRWRLANRAYYDLVISGIEPTVNILELIRDSISNKRDR